MSSFHALSGGKTCIASRIRSASGVPNITGAVIGGIGGRHTLGREGESGRSRGHEKTESSRCHGRPGLHVVLHRF